MYTINKYKNIILTFILLILIFTIGTVIKSSNQIILIIIMFGFLIVIINSLFQLILPNINNKIINFIKNILDKISGVFLLIILEAKSYSMGFFMMIIFFIILSVLLELISRYTLSGTINNRIIIYLSSTITLFVSSYYGYKLIDIFIKFFGQTKGIISGYSNYKFIEHFTKINFRKLCYIISIVSYIITRIISLSDFTLVNESYELFSSVITEVFLTFVSIDGYICNFRNDLIEKNNQELNKIKEQYLYKYKYEYEKYKHRNS